VSSAASAPRHEELLDGLEHIFVREGYRRVTVGELAARLRCSRRSLYELAESKADLFLLVIERVLSRIERRGNDAVRNGTTATERFTALLRPGLEELSAATPAFFADIERLAAARKRLAHHQESRQRELRHLIAKGVRAGECRKVHAQLAAHAMLAAYRAVTESRFLTEVDASLGEAVGEVRDLFLYGLVQRSEADTADPGESRGTRGATLAMSRKLPRRPPASTSRS
jgi:AcrR family transcriptional regulator